MRLFLANSARALGSLHDEHRFFVLRFILVQSLAGTTDRPPRRSVQDQPRSGERPLVDRAQHGQATQRPGSMCVARLDL